MKLDKEILEDLCLNVGLSVKEIAEELCVSRDTIYRYLYRYDIRESTISDRLRLGRKSIR